MGIEPTRSAWKAEVLPLNYIRVYATVQLYHLKRGMSSLNFQLFKSSKIRLAFLLKTAMVYCADSKLNKNQ